MFQVMRIGLMLAAVVHHYQTLLSLTSKMGLY